MGRVGIVAPPSRLDHNPALLSRHGEPWNPEQQARVPLELRKWGVWILFTTSRLCVYVVAEALRAPCRGASALA
eukprot:10206399-Heterocapsa_arctica.AAC.1